MLKNGINYKTNRKIKIGSNTYNKILQNEFSIKNYSSPYCYSYIHFEKLNGIDSEIYLQETETIKKEIEDYNLQIDNICNEINKIELWNNYIEFEGKKYGIPKIYNNIHKENDCNGIMDFYKIKEYECKGCRDGMPFNGSYSCNCYNEKIYKCNKCNYEY